MRTICISYHRGKRGVSTVLGAIIFIGILFSAVLPMYLFMRQADTIYDQTMFEMKRQDEARDREDLKVYVYPENLTSNEVNVTIKNIGEELVHVVRLWVNDTYISWNVTIPALGEESLEEPLVLDREAGSEYDVRVTTDRGNVFTSDCGILRYGDEGWEMDSFSIYIFTSGLSLFLRIRVWEGEEPVGDPIYDEWSLIGGAGYRVDVPEPGWYYVKVTKWGSTLYDDKVEIEWPFGEPTVWIFV